MFISRSNTYYTSSGEQRASKAWYLMLATRQTGLGISDQDTLPTGQPALYACVRKVAFTQFGHFMMGTARVGGHSITLSGPIGNDGMPMTICDYVDGKPVVAYGDVPSDTLRHWTRVPDQLALDYWANDVDRLRVWAQRLVMEQKAKAMSARELRCYWRPTNEGSAAFRAIGRRWASAS